MDKGQPRFLRYTLLGPKGESLLIGARDALILDQGLQILSQVRVEPDESVAMIEQRKLSQQEMRLLKPLLDAYPDWVPTEELLSVYTGNSVAQCRAEWHQALDEGESWTVIKPVIGIISRARRRLLAFRIDIRPVLLSGYLLVPAVASTRKYDLEKLAI